MVTAADGVDLVSHCVRDAIFCVSSNLYLLTQLCNLKTLVRSLWAFRPNKERLLVFYKLIALHIGLHMDMLILLSTN